MLRNLCLLALIGILVCGSLAYADDKEDAIMAKTCFIEKVGAKDVVCLKLDWEQVKATQGAGSWPFRKAHSITLQKHQLQALAKALQLENIVWARVDLVASKVVEEKDAKGKTVKKVIYGWEVRKEKDPKGKEHTNYFIRRAKDRFAVTITNPCKDVNALIHYEETAIPEDAPVTQTEPTEGK